MRETIVVGAGCAGLSFARALGRAGGRNDTLVIDKARGVGGRCATRRVEGQPVDHGLAFFHGSHPAFLSAIDGVEGERLSGWPRSVSGAGRPCQPEAFFRGQSRLAFYDGVSAFPKFLAKELDTQLETRVAALEVTASRIRVETDGGPGLEARTVVLALPLEQTQELLETLPARNAELDATRALLAMLGSEPCLALIAGYSLEIRPPEWDVLYPEASDALALVSHDSSKRSQPRFLVLVYQCSPRFSRRHLDDDESVWSDLVLNEASRSIGAWCGAPLWTQAHRWRHARVGRAASLTAPILIELRDGPRVGLVGEVFGPEGGIEGAFLSGRRLALRLLTCNGVSRA